MNRKNTISSFAELGSQGAKGSEAIQPGGGGPRTKASRKRGGGGDVGRAFYDPASQPTNEPLLTASVSGKFSEGMEAISGV